jgi:apolipoprotein N-acyltransferase
LENSSRPLIYALCSGLLLILSFPGAAGWWPCAWLALIPLFAAVRNVPLDRAFRLGLLAGFVHYTFLLYWILIVLGTYGHIALWVTVPALLLLSLYMSLYPALFALVISWHMQRGRSLIWLAPALWVSLDYIRGQLFTGFPWQDLAYSQYRAVALIQTADLVGHYGITFLIVLANSLTFSLALRSPIATVRRTITNSALSVRQPLLSPIVAAIVIVAALTYSLLRYEQMTVRISRCPTLPVAVIQGNIDQDRKWTPTMQQQTLKIYGNLSAQALAAIIPAEKPMLLVWPETALPVYISSGAEVPTPVTRLASEHGCCLLTGVPFVENSFRDARTGAHYYNSAILLGPAGTLVDRYDKVHLVPFGEYIPFRKYLPFVGPVVESMGDFTPGTVGHPLACQTARIGVLICFESIFPDLARKWAANGANLLVNLTNDAWFGRSSAPWQHFSMAVFRAIETRRSLARAANTGVSGFIDPLGRTTAILPLFQEGYAIAEVALCRVGTFFIQYGHYFPVLCMLGVVIIIVWRFRAEREGWIKLKAQS